jgi:predicted DNA-binding protein YlxM (UPF0122 family)
MRYGKCRELTESEFANYAKGISVREIAEGNDISHSSIRQKLEDAGVIRSKADATRVARARKINLNNQSNLTQKENGKSYDAVLSQDWLKKQL